MQISAKLQNLLFAGLALCAFYFGNSLHESNHTKNQPRTVASTGDVRYSKFVHFQNLHLLSFDKDKAFYLANTESYAELFISNELQSQDMVLTLSCNLPFQLAPKSLNTVISQRDFTAANLNHFEFHLKRKESIAILFSEKINSCVLKYEDSKNPSVNSSLSLKAEIGQFPWLAELNSYQDSCRYAPLGDSDGVDKLFYSQAYPQLSCIHTIHDFETLETPESGFLAKTELLLGKKISPHFITDQNPFAELDFSNAPKLKAIFLATLVYRDDFYGTVMARLLKHHADHGI